MILNAHTGELPTSAKRSKPRRVISRDHFIRIGALTPRQHEVMELEAKGMTSEEIGKALGIKTPIVNHHLLNIRATYKVGTNAGAMAKWMEGRKQ